MTDLSQTIIAKSDQLNADDLIGRSITVTVTKVTASGEAEQPISVHYEGDQGKPYKPGKSMRRVMVAMWGPQGAAYVGKSMTLYRDDKVRFGGIEVGGIRISHMSHIDREQMIALTATRGNKKPFTVKPLRMPERTADRPSTTREASDEETQSGAGGDQPAHDLAGTDVDILDWAASFTRGLADIETGAEVEAAFKKAKAGGYVLKLKAKSEDMARQLVAAVNARFGELGGG